MSNGLYDFNTFLDLGPIVTALGGLVVSVSASLVVGRGFTPWPGQKKDNYENCTNCLPAWHAGIRVGV